MMKGMSHFWHRLRDKAGFTMIELLIVITIIGIISAIGVANFVSSQKKARDTSRRTSVKAIQDAMEQYYVQNGNSYANGCTDANLATYLPGGMPEDPGNSNITCDETGGGTGYCAWSTLERDTTGNCDASCDAQTDGPVFCLKNLQ